MIIKSLKDLKLALKDIPEEDLDALGFNYGNEPEEVCLQCWDGEDPQETWNRIEEKYPQVLDINKWVRAIIKQGIVTNQEAPDEDPEEMISSEDIK